MINEQELISMLKEHIDSHGYQSVSGLYEAINIIENYVKSLKDKGEYIVNPLQ